MLAIFTPRIRTLQHWSSFSHRGSLIRDVVTSPINAKVRNMPREFQTVSESAKAGN